MKNADMPASPVIVKATEQAKAHGCVDAQYQGLTKREMFAMHAMQGLLARGRVFNIYSAPEESVSIADALLAELEKCEN